MKGAELFIMLTGMAAITAGIIALRLAIKAAAWAVVEGEWIKERVVEWWEA